ncbi:hypothetical protein [Paraburkholderia caribensis]|uniref:hypothetical protein n=1 Tax=Paraburkholderia caribensis TaxID=75105 RepID=UPI001CB5587B|nr:hypothetical protein [Paraburkholderia caribensis]MDR6382457.1 hypothetical protein [Paraburkholderia caribensis]CAG9189130.1 conserved hypothetical protein [Paraburkholderia caribensis]
MKLASQTIDTHRLREARTLAAACANAEDASVWRWFSALMESGKIRWCLRDKQWLVTVNHRHVATASSFDEAIRTAKARSGFTHM